VPQTALVVPSSREPAHPASLIRARKTTPFSTRTAVVAYGGAFARSEPRPVLHTKWPFHPSGHREKPYHVCFSPSARRTSYILSRSSSLSARAFFFSLSPFFHTFCILAPFFFICRGLYLIIDTAPVAGGGGPEGRAQDDVACI